MQDNAADGSCSRSKPGTLSFETEPRPSRGHLTLFETRTRESARADSRCFLTDWVARLRDTPWGTTLKGLRNK